MTKTESRGVHIDESRLLELIDKEKRLESLLVAYPELENGEKVTPTAKKYREAFATFVGRVELVLSSQEMLGVFTLAHIHGINYSGPNLAEDIVKAKALLKI